MEMDQFPCPDGFLIDAGDRLRHAHEQINFWLVALEEALEEAEAVRRPSDFLEAKRLRKQFRPEQLVDLLDASIVRAQWHAGGNEHHRRRIQSVLVSIARLPLELDDGILAS